jgi:hypothetical protein
VKEEHVKAAKENFRLSRQPDGTPGKAEAVAQLAEHRRKHFCTVAGVVPALRVGEWNNFVICLLHLYLQITRKLIEICVFEFVQSEDVAKNVIDFFRRFGVQFHVVYGQESAPSAGYLESLKKHSWIGRDCDMMHDYIGQVMDIVFQSKTDATSQQHKASAVSVFKAFSDAYHAVSHVSDFIALEPQVAAMKTRIDFFWQMLRQHYSGKQYGIYLHYLMAHVPELTLKHGNLVKYSGQALEHLHSTIKKISSQCGRAHTACRDALRLFVLRSVKAYEVGDGMLVARTEAAV